MQCAKKAMMKQCLNITFPKVFSEYFFIFLFQDNIKDILYLYYINDII